MQISLSGSSTCAHPIACGFHASWRASLSPLAFARVYSGLSRRLCSHARDFSLESGAVAPGGCLLIFPEDPQPSLLTRRRAFAHSGIRSLAWANYGTRKQDRHWGFIRSRFTPSRKIWIGEPVFFNPLNRPVLERRHITRNLERAIQDRYRKMEESIARFNPTLALR